MILGCMIGLLIGVLLGLNVFAAEPKDYRYKIRGQDNKFYKVNKVVTETWADGLAKFICVELVDENKRTLNVEDD